MLFWVVGGWMIGFPVSILWFLALGSLNFEFGWMVCTSWSHGVFLKNFSMWAWNVGCFLIMWEICFKPPKNLRKFCCESFARKWIKEWIGRNFYGALVLLQTWAPRALWLVLEALQQPEATLEKAHVSVRRHKVKKLMETAHLAHKAPHTGGSFWKACAKCVTLCLPRCVGDLLRLAWDAHSGYLLAELKWVASLLLECL